MKIYEICPDCGGDCNPQTHVPLDRDVQPEYHGDCKNCTDGTLWEADTFEIGKKYLDENLDFTFLENITITENNIVLEFSQTIIELPITATYKVKKTGEIETVTKT